MKSVEEKVALKLLVTNMTAKAFESVERNSDDSRWKPMRGELSTAELVIRDNQLSHQFSWGALLVCLMFLGMFGICFVLSSNKLYEAIIVLAVGTGVFALIIYYLVCHVRFVLIDKNVGQLFSVSMYAMKSGKLGAPIADIRDINSIQLLAIHKKDFDKYGWNDSDYANEYMFQINLMLKNGRRINLFQVRYVLAALSDARNIARFLNV